MDMKLCPKCNKEFEPVIKHGYEPKFCSRKCANSKAWSDEDKLKKSLSAKLSERVKFANTTDESREARRQAAIKQHAEGRGILPSMEDRLRGIKNALKVRREKFLMQDSSIKENYRRLCKFRFNLSAYPNEFDFSLIKEFGWYSAKNKGANTNGVSRDHMLSIADGWRLGIDPMKISHPANCRLIKHTENWNKRGKSILTEEELDKRILLWEKKYLGH